MRVVSELKELSDLEEFKIQKYLIWFLYVQRELCGSKFSQLSPKQSLKFYDGVVNFTSLEYLQKGEVGNVSKFHNHLRKGKAKIEIVWYSKFYNYLQKGEF